MLEQSQSPRLFILFQEYLEQKCGLKVIKGKEHLIESRLSKLMSDLRCSNNEELYYKINDKNEFIETVINSITPKETMWFRDKGSWEIIEDYCLPNYVEKMRKDKLSKLRIWSMACSTGQEPYSMAMCIDRYLKINNITDIRPSQFEIIATDISQNSLNIARNVIYDNISIIRGLTNEYRDIYFKRKDRYWTINEEIRSRVKFIKFNLQGSFSNLRKFDIVLCKHVLMYFTMRFKLDVISKIALSLDPDGMLFIGGSEIFTDYSDKFYKREHGSRTYYQLKG